MTGPADAHAADAIVAGERRALARGITLVESTRPRDRAAAAALVDRVLDHTGGAVRIGFTGTPGVGKSTLIDTFGLRLVEQGLRLAVLAVDPSSNRTGGSILGDKTRMGALSNRPEVFIRPSPSGGLTGGIARRTRDAMLLCEAAGFDVIIIETMGVGQAETAVADISDVFVLLVAPGGGDDLQGIKRGVMELADVVAVNKCDGAQADQARHTAADYRHALGLVRPKWPGIEPAVLTCSARTGAGLDELWQAISSFHHRLGADGRLAALRADQAIRQFEAEFDHTLRSRARQVPGIEDHRRDLVAAIGSGDRSPSSAADELTDALWAAAPPTAPARP
ncbi:MAG: methylmalonyl Co-A mutase-associated GTPase MeaB [Acidimicrobiales bacterium]